ncbi:hypothetical protein JD844_004216 [Phrynosoma platyrhinos]|uniref:Uncharacterized protein n=1 Tax=Phrynosoma platyrhinos TaxID=52577 RepID=A0ABQ7TMN3_PHRPL|nr:hypothetical protein JD844_004216 [Phrynosoma platyrhinos]
MPHHLARLVRLGPSVHRVQVLSSFGVGHRHRMPAVLPPGRSFSSSSKLQDGPGDTDSPDKVLLHFINRNGEKFSVTAKEGESLLEVVVNQNLNIDGFGLSTPAGPRLKEASPEHGNPD